MRLYFQGMVTIFSLLGMASQAFASIVDVTYTGIVVYDFDRAGNLGPSGLNKAVGDAYTARYRFDTSKGQVFSSATTNYAHGGGYSDPLISATVTVGTYTYGIAGE